MNEGALNDANVYTPDELDALVELWHEGAGPGLQLHEFLGFTWDEYGRWTQTGYIPGT